MSVPLAISGATLGRPRDPAVSGYPDEGIPQVRHRTDRISVIRTEIRRLALISALIVVGACRRDRGGEPLPPGDYTPRPSSNDLSAAGSDRARIRADALRRAKVWLPPSAPIPSVDFTRNPPGPGGFDTDAVIPCRFELKSSEGRTPKFQCVVAGGDVLKVKYGRNNPETFGEVAATRLVAALGFGADRMHVVARVRCFGCPAYPHPKVGIFDALRTDWSRAVDFDMAVIERRR